MQSIRRISSAHVIALLALFVALGGSAYAIHLGKNAVKTRNIKNGAVIESKLAGGAVTSAKLAAGAFGGGNLGHVEVRVATKPMPDNAGGLAIAACESGERLIGGAEGVSAGNSPDIVLNADYPSLADGSAVAAGQSPTAWTVSANNYAGGDPATAAVIAYALCLK